VATSSAFESYLERIAARLDPAGAEGVPAAGGGVTHAAVLLLLRVPAGDLDGAAEILFIKRAERAGDPWSGHLAFPGGRAASGDRTLLEIAVREAAEEVGIHVGEGGRILGRLPTFHPMSARIPSVSVTPFVAAAPPGAVTRVQPEEVQEAFWESAAALRGAGRSASVTWGARGGARQLPAYPSSRGPIWGITERILSQFLELGG